MPIKYPHMFFMRITEEDRRQIEEASAREDIPPSTLARKVLRQWLRSNDFTSSEKPQAQMLMNPPAAKKAC